MIQIGGTHLLVDLYGVSSPLTCNDMMSILNNACKKAGAEVLKQDQHIFSRNALSGDAFTGYILLAESHCSIHTWPERRYIGIDFFFCGEADYEKAIQHVRENFIAEDIEITEFTRGQLNEGSYRELQRT